MRIDGYSPAYVSSRTTRPDAVAASDAQVRQDESRSRQGDALSGHSCPQSLQAISQLQAQEEYQRYQERQTGFSRQNLPWQNQQAMASYSTTANMTDDAQDANQVLGLDLYA